MELTATVDLHLPRGVCDALKLDDDSTYNSR